jgi:hypothetical protein
MAMRDPAPHRVPPEAGPGADPAVPDDAVADDAVADVLADAGPDTGPDTAAGDSGPVAQLPIPLRRPTGRGTPLPMPLRSGLSRATQWRQRAQLEPIATTLRRVARHPAVVGSASAATALAARAGVDVLRRAIIEDRRRQLPGRVFVRRRVVVEYVEMWSRSR